MNSNKNLPASAVLVLMMTLSGCLSPSGNQDNKVDPPASSPASVAPQQGEIQNISNAELERLVAEGVTLVHIRRPDDWQATGVVSGSKKLTFVDGAGNMNPQFFPMLMALAPTDKPVALICRTGNRTMAAAQMLTRAGGYSKVYNVTHGITGWLAERRPVVR